VSPREWPWLGLIAVLLVVTSPLASALGAEGESQTETSDHGIGSVRFRDGLLSLDVQGAAWTEILDAIRAESGIQFSIRGPLPDRPVTASVRNLPVEGALRHLLGPEFNMLLFYGTSVAGKDSVPVLAEVWVVPRSKEESRDGTATGPGREAPPAVGEAVRASKDLSAIEQLGQLLGAGDKAPEPEATAKAMEMLRSPEAIAGIRQLLEDPDENVRNTALEALAAIGDRETIRLLQQALQDPNFGRSAGEAQAGPGQAR